MKKALFAVTALLVLVSLACGFGGDGVASIADATLARDSEGSDPTTTFQQDDIFYVLVDLVDAPDDTTVRAIWTVVDAEGVDSDQVIDEVELTSSSGSLQFDLTNDKLWPPGRYKVDLYLNDELDRTLPFEVEGAAVAAESDVSELTATPESTPTPEPEPTATPEPEEPTATPRTSAGDTLGGQKNDGTDASDSSDAGPEEALESEPLPFQAEPYVHPSGAFSFGVPENWELVNEDELSATFGDRLSRQGAVFVDTGQPLAEDEMIEFIANSLDIIVDTFADDYEIEGENNQLEETGLYFVTVSFSEGDGAADFFFEQRDSVIFILYFTSLQYLAMEPTWDAIIDSYQIDVDAAMAALQEEAAPTPLPPPTRAPAANPFAPPAGVARVYLQNFYANEYNIDFGDGSGSITVMPGADNFYRDLPPGKYNPGLSLPGGGATNVEFEIAPNQSWVIIVTEDLGVRAGQVYP